jgi:hypothetical protein
MDGTRRAPTPEALELMLNKARRERSLAFWTMLQAVFGRPEAREAAEARLGPTNAGDRGVLVAGH